MPKWLEYLIATIALPLTGAFIAGMSFAFLFSSGQDSSVKELFLIPVLLAIPFVLPYAVVKFLNVAWWYPAALLAAPIAIWFVTEMRSENTHPYILLVPFFFITVVSLLGGKLGAKHGQLKNT